MASSRSYSSVSQRGSLLNTARSLIHTHTASAALQLRRKACAAPQNSPQLPPTRLQQQVDQLVALDVEFAHFKAPGVGGRVEHLPAEVCLVDARGATLLRTLCNPLSPSQAAQWEFVGGVPPREWRDAPPLSQVREELRARLQGRILVGHNLPKDLASLGISHPRDLMRDTMRYRQLQGGRKQGQRLAALSEAKLGRRIQGGDRHDPREDALAALDLYLQHVHLDPSTMGYQDLVEHHLAEILGRAGGARGMEGSPEGDSKCAGGGREGV